MDKKTDSHLLHAFAALFPTHFQVLLGILVVSPYFSVQLAHNKGKIFFRKEQKHGHRHQSLSGNSSAGLAPKVSGSKGRQGTRMKLFKQLLHLVNLKEK